MILENDEEDSSTSESDDNIFGEEEEEEEESGDIPWVEETTHSRKVQEEGEDDFPDTASIIYGER